MEGQRYECKKGDSVLVNNRKVTFLEEKEVGYTILNEQGKVEYIGGNKISEWMYREPTPPRLSRSRISHLALNNLNRTVKRMGYWLGKVSDERFIVHRNSEIVFAGNARQVLSFAKEDTANVFLRKKERK